MKYLIVTSLISLLSIKTTMAQPQIITDTLLSVISNNKQIIGVLRGSSCNTINARITAMRVTVSQPKLENTGNYSDIELVEESYELPSYQGEVQFGQPTERTFSILPTDITHISENKYRIQYIPQSLYGGNIFLYHKGVDPLRWPQTPKPNDVQEVTIAIEDDGRILWNPWIQMFHYRDHSPQAIHIRPVANISWSYNEFVYEEETIEVFGDNRRYTDGEGREWRRHIYYAGATDNTCVLQRLVSSVPNNESP